MKVLKNVFLYHIFQLDLNHKWNRNSDIYFYPFTGGLIPHHPLLKKKSLIYSRICPAGQLCFKRSSDWYIIFISFPSRYYLCHQYRVFRHSTWKNVCDISNFVWYIQCIYSYLFSAKVEDFLIWYKRIILIKTNV